MIFVLPSNPIALASGDFFDQVLAGAWSAGERLGVAVEAWGLDAGDDSCAGVDAYAALVREAGAAENLLGVVALPAAPEKCANNTVIADMGGAAIATTLVAINGNPGGAAAAGAAAFVGQDELAAGRAACADLIGAGARAVVFIDLIDGTDPGINDRLAGCKAAAAAADAAVAYVNTPDEDALFDENVQKIAAAIEGADGAGVGLFAMGGATQVELMLAAANATGLAPAQAVGADGKSVVLGTTDWSPRGALDALASGLLRFVVDQQAPLQGSIPVHFISMVGSIGANLVAEGGPFMLWTGPKLVTPDEVQGQYDAAAAAAGGVVDSDGVAACRSFGRPPCAHACASGKGAAAAAASGGARACGWAAAGAAGAAAALPLFA